MSFNRYRYISKAYKNALKLDIDNTSKLVLFSDCHRGTGDYNDNFMPNSNIYFNALSRYYTEGYTYIELGDGDELWENKKFSYITKAHSNVFWMLQNFYKAGRMYMIYGNHDLVKRKEKWRDNNLQTWWNERMKVNMPLFQGITVYESIVLNHKETGKKLFLLHGHQADFFNYNLWKLSRFLVRNVWRPLELIGIKDPTNTAESRSKIENVELQLMGWAEKYDMILMAGHTHRMAFPEQGEPKYFNDGCCVRPQEITAIEITNGEISLVKWGIMTRADGTLFIGRAVTEGPKAIEYFFADT